MIIQFKNFRSGDGFPLFCPDPVLREEGKNSHHSRQVLDTPAFTSPLMGIYEPQTKLHSHNVHSCLLKGVLARERIRVVY
jgi:hypothetical protein